MVKFADEDEEEKLEEEEIKRSRIKFKTYQELQEDEDEEEEFKLTDLFLITFAQKLHDKKRELVLRGNDLFLRKGYRLVDKDIEPICDWLRQHHEVTAIDLSYNRITNSGLNILLEFLMESDHITRLNLMCNDIDSEGMQKLAEMKDNLTIHSLRVNGNKIGSEGGKQLALLLDNNHHLRHLDVGDSDQSTTGLTYLLRVMQYSNSTLQFLDISRPIAIASGCGFDSEYTADLIGQVLQFNSTLKELVLQKMDLVDSDLEALMRGLSQNQTLLLLDLSCNEIADDGLTMLSDYLFTRPPLKALLLGHNRIRDLGLDSLARALQVTRLQILDLAENLFTDSGLQFFLNTIKKPFPLKALYIWGNEIGKKSARVLRRMLYSGVLVQDMLDVIVYRVDRSLAVARNIVDHYKHIYYCVGDYGFPPPVRIKPPRPDVIPTQRILPRKPRFKSKSEKLPETVICAQAATADLAPAPIELTLDDVELKEELQMKNETLLLQDDGSLKSAGTMEKEKATERKYRIPRIMIPMRLEDVEQLRKESTLLSLEKLELLASDSRTPSILSAKDCTWYTDDYRPMKFLPSVHEEETIEATHEMSIQTSLEFDGEPRFSLPYVQYVPPYPIGMVSIIEEESRVPPEPSLYPEVKAAYVRKFQLPDEFAEGEFDLSDDPNYVLNRGPLFPEPEEEPKPEPEVKEESISEPEPEAVSPYVSSESEPGETISKYQILEKNIYGVEPTAPLPRDYEEALENALQNLKRDSERSLWQVIEECYILIIQRSRTLAWRAFGRDILIWAVENAFDQIGVLREQMGRELVEEAITGVFESTIISTDILQYTIEKVFQEILADRETLAVALIDEALDVAIERIRASIYSLAQSAVNQAVDNVFEYLRTRNQSADLESIELAVTKVLDESDMDLENMEAIEIGKMVVREAVDRVFEELRKKNELD